MTTRDVHWNKVALLLPLDADPWVEARHNWTLTDNGSPTILADDLFDATTATTVFTGGTSAPTGNNGCQIRTSTADPMQAQFLDLGNGDFTIEAWVLADMDDLDMCSDAGDNAFLPYPIIERQSASTATGAWAIQYAIYRIEDPPDPDVKEVHLHAYFGDYHANLPMLDYNFGVSPPFPDVYYHIAVTRQGDEFTLWLNGVPLDTQSSTVAIQPSLNDVRIGNSIFDTASNGFGQAGGRGFIGRIGQVRVTRGLARYGRSFEDAFVAGPNQINAPWPTAENTGQYENDPTLTGATGAAGADATGAQIDGAAGPPGAAGRATRDLTLPAPAPRYDQTNETQMRRAVEAALRRG